MQLQGELQKKGSTALHYRGPLHGVGVIVRNEGVRGIYRGLGCAYIYQVMLNGCRLGFYDPMRSGLSTLLFKDANKQNLGINMFCGAASGIIGAAAGSPFFLVKTRLQSFSPSLPVGTQHQYKNAIDGMSRIFKAEGLGGLYRGVGAAMIRTGFGSSVQLPTYFFAKRRLIKHAGMEEGPALHLTSSAVSGFVVCCFMHPPGGFLLLPALVFGEYLANSAAHSKQIRSCPDCTTSTVISTRVSSIASARRSAPRVSLLCTRASCHTWPESYRTRSSPFRSRSRRTSWSVSWKRESCRLKRRRHERATRTRGV